MTNDQLKDLDECGFSPSLFIRRHCRIYDATAGDWIPFSLWPAQRSTLEVIHENQLSVVLKARQLGLTWLVLSYALWLMIFHPAATVLLFSRRDTEAVYLLSEERLRGIWQRLPPWLRSGHEIVRDGAHEWTLSNGSTAKAFPTTAGDSYTATLAIVDEADLAPDLNKLMRAVKPTIDGGGQMILLSRSDKSRPQSEFKRIYRAAKRGQNEWAHVFLPWHARPERDAAWYAAQKRDILSRTASLDDLHEQYPASDTEAISPRTLDKRIPAAWLEACFVEMVPLAEVPGSPAIPGLEVYRSPEAGRSYVIGGDPAEGNPTSDDSGVTVLEQITGEEVAVLAGKVQPSTLGAHIDSLSKWYNGAPAMVERNNHGHAVLLWLRDNSSTRRLSGLDGKEGWLSSTRGKTALYDAAADAFKEGDTIVHSFDSFTQLASIDGSTLRAPEGDHDDRADSYALALVGRIYNRGSGIWLPE